MKTIKNELKEDQNLAKPQVPYEILKRLMKNYMEVTKVNDIENRLGVLEKTNPIEAHMQNGLYFGEDSTYTWHCDCINVPAAKLRSSNNHSNHIRLFLLKPPVKCDYRGKHFLALNHLSKQQVEEMNKNSGDPTMSVVSQREWIEDIDLDKYNQPLPKCPPGYITPEEWELKKQELHDNRKLD